MGLFWAIYLFFGIKNTVISYQNYRTFLGKTTVKDTNYIVCTHSTFFCTLLKKIAHLPYGMHPVAYKLHPQGKVPNTPYML